MLKKKRIKGKNLYKIYIKLLVNLLVILSFIILTITPSSSVENDLEKWLPTPAKHSLPSSLDTWKEELYSGDYFGEIEPSMGGYLILSEFPIKVYFDRPSNPNDTAATTHRFNQWVKAVEKSISDWNIYLPMVEVQEPELAQIIIQRTNPPINSQIDPETGHLQIPRAKTAQARYEFYVKNNHLFHKMIIQISPSLGQLATLSAARHELGHALGIWGHSPYKNDALYFSQVNPSIPISARDINTLKKIYEQPTRLGWPLPGTK